MEYPQAQAVSGNEWSYVALAMTPNEEAAIGAVDPMFRESHSTSTFVWAQALRGESLTSARRIRSAS